MIKRTYIYLLFFLWEYVFYLTLQNGACVKSASQYEWKCIEVKIDGYCSLPMENKDKGSWSESQNENGSDWRYGRPHKWCPYFTREDCEQNRCQWYSGGDPRFLGEIPVCADKSAPNDRSKDSKNSKVDCKDPIPDCSSEKYEWKCIYDDGSGLGGKCVLKTSGTTPSEKWCLQNIPGDYAQCSNRPWRSGSPSCTIKLKGWCSYSKENCEKCKGELGGGKPYWYEGLSFDRCKDIKTQEECGKRTECKWENDKFGFVPREVPVCVDKSAPNDRSKDSKNPDIDCSGTKPPCNISINFDKNCKNTNIHSVWFSTGALLDQHFGVFAHVDFGCSIRNIRYQDTDYCGEESNIFLISGDIKNSWYQIPLPSHEPSISFKNYPQWENDKRSRKYTYDVYSGEERVSPDKELLIKAIPCISWKPRVSTDWKIQSQKGCLMLSACN